MKVKIFALSILGAMGICVGATVTMVGSQSEEQAAPIVPRSGNFSRTSAPSASTVRSLFLTHPESEGDARVLLLTMRPTGFEPSELTLPMGQYLLVVRNRTGLRQFTLRLERETGEILHEASARRYQRDWKRRLQMTPGTYVLKETNHPEWICRITVAAR